MRLDALLERRLSGLAAAQRRAEGAVAQNCDAVMLEVRKAVARTLRDIETRKGDAQGKLTGLERHIDSIWTRKQTSMAGRPPAARVELNDRVAELKADVQVGRRADGLHMRPNGEARERCGAL